MANSRVKGLDRLNRQIAALSQLQVQAASDSLAQGADELRDAIKRNVPRGFTGHLADSVGWDWADAEAQPGQLSTSPANGQGSSRKATLGAAKLAVVVHAGDDEAFYARFVEFGTSAAPAGTFHDAKGKTRTNSQEHHATPPQPFFWPIVRAFKQRVKSRVVRNANKAAKEAAKVR